MNCRMSRWSCKALLWLFLVPLRGSASPSCIPKPPGTYTPVVDRANRIDDAFEENVLKPYLMRLAVDGLTQIVIYTTTDLCGMDMAQFANRLGETWGVGWEGEDNGLVILVVFPPGGGGMVFVAPGRGIQDALPDAVVKRIVDRDILPHLREGDLEGGLWEGIRAIRTRLQLKEPRSVPHAPLPPPQDQRPAQNPWKVGLAFVFFLFVNIAIALYARHIGECLGKHYAVKHHLVPWLREHEQTGKIFLSGGKGPLTGQALEKHLEHLLDETGLQSFWITLFVEFFYILITGAGVLVAIAAFVAVHMGLPPRFWLVTALITGLAVVMSGLRTLKACVQELRLPFTLDPNRYLFLTEEDDKGTREIDDQAFWQTVGKLWGSVAAVADLTENNDPVPSPPTSPGNEDDVPPFGGGHFNGGGAGGSF